MAKSSSVMGEPGVRQALVDLAGAVLPLSTRGLQRELEERLALIPNEINEYGYDAYGLSPDFMRRSLLPGALLYKYWFRCETRDIDRLPQGRMLLIANHAGQLPFDGMMLSMALILEAEPPRIARGMAEYFVSRLPWVGTAAARGGAMVGTMVLAALAAVVGHNWSVFLKFRGGRGVTTYFGGMMALSWPTALLGGELFIISAFTTRFVSLGSIAAVVGTYALMILFTVFYNWPLEFLLYALIGTIVIIIMHRGNINRLLTGNERRLGEKAEELQEPTPGDGEG